MLVVRAIEWLLVVFAVGVERLDAGYRDIGCTLISEMGLKTAKCINLNLVKVPSEMETDVQMLHLLKNQITSLDDDSFVNMYSLQSLYLSDNWISHVSEHAFKSLQSLQSLHLDGNMLREVPRTSFKHLKQLRVLNLGYNPIWRIHSNDFSYLLNLETLKFENCKLSTIDASSFDWLPQLYELNIIGNQLSNLDGRLSGAFKKISILRLHNNPWVCDCHLKWLRLAVEIIPNWSFGKNSPLCHAPALLSGMHWKHLDARKFACASVIVSSYQQFNGSNNLQLKEGSNGSLECKAWGDPLPEVFWMKGQQEVNEDNYAQESVQLETEGDGVGVGSEKRGVKSVLRLIDFRKEDNDNYKCVAENSAGRSEVTYQVVAIDKIITLESNSDESKVNLTFEVTVGIIFGCFLLLGCVLFGLILALGKQQKAKKMVKRKKSNKKHQQLLYDENEKKSKMWTRKNEWSDKFIDASSEHHKRTKDGDKESHKSDEISQKKLVKEKNKEKEKVGLRNSYQSSKNKIFFQHKGNMFFSTSKKHLKKKTSNDNKPDILNNDNEEEEHSHATMNMKQSVQSPPSSNTSLSLPYWSKPMYNKHSCLHQPASSCTTPNQSTPFACSRTDKNMMEKTPRDVNAASKNTPVSMSASLIYNFPNADKMPLKTILKQPSKNFDERRNDLSTSQPTYTPLTTTCQENTDDRESNNNNNINNNIDNNRNIFHKYPQKNGRPPDIYATLPGRVSAQVNSHVAAVSNAISNMRDDVCIVDAGGKQTNSTCKNEEFELVQVGFPETCKPHSNQATKALANDEKADRAEALKDAPLINPTVSYPSSSAPPACIQSCIQANIHASFHTTTPQPHSILDHSHSTMPHPPFLSTSQHAIKSASNSPGSKNARPNQSSTTCNNRNSLRRQHKVLSPHRLNRATPDYHTSSHELAYVSAPSSHGGLYSKNDTVSVTSLNDILNPPFKSPSPSPQTFHQVPRHKRMNHLDFGTTV